MRSSLVLVYQFLEVQVYGRDKVDRGFQRTCGSSYFQHEIDQIMTCSVWLKQVWTDSRLSWDPNRYGDVNVLYIPYEMIWVPDIVLYNKSVFT